MSSTGMSTAARLAFNAYTASIAALSGYGAGAAIEGFTVEPSIQQKLETKVQESSAFLKAINVVPVTELKGEKLALGIGGPIASRTNTAGGTKRATADGTTLDAQGYECQKTNSDTHVRYSKLDTWAKFPDFQQRMRALVIERQALDNLMIGFNGVSIAATTNKATYPLLQDVNKGWLQKIREHGGAKWFKEGEDAGIIKIGADGDYANLDALVMDALELMPTWARTDTGLVAVVGHNLIHDKYFPMVNVSQAPTEQIAAGQIMSQKRLGAKSVVEAPYFPSDAILITRLDNLSRYYQEGGRRSRTIDNPALDQVETYESSNDDYVVESYDHAVLIENISTDPADWD